MGIAESLRGKRVLVTGLTGFKGHWLGLWLEHLAAEVTGFALPPTGEMQRGWPDLARRLPCEHGDVRDAKAVLEVFRRQQPEVVFHLAAQALVRESYQDPVGTYASNVMGTVHVLDAARHTPSVKTVIVITSDKCYENREWHWGYRECEPMGGYDPYSCSKGCAELVTESYRRSFCDEANSLTIASARAGNVIGGGDWGTDRLVPDIARAIVADNPIVIRRPQAIRPWQHVLECLSGYLTLAHALVCQGDKFTGAWNFGPHDTLPLTVRDVARQIVTCWGEGRIVEEATTSGPHENRYLKLDSSKALAELGWHTVLTPTERFDWTVEWYRAWQKNPASVWEVAREQIDHIEQKIKTFAPLNRHWGTEPLCGPTTSRDVPHLPTMRRAA